MPRIGDTSEVSAAFTATVYAFIIDSGARRA